MDVTLGSSIERRVYLTELRDRLGWSDTWAREQQKRGVIPVGHKDPGGRRQWYSESEARQIIENLKQGTSVNPSL